MAAAEGLSRLEQLPWELQMAIVAHLPPHTAAIRRHSSLFALSRASRALHHLLTPLVNAEIRLATPQHLERFMDAPTQFIRRLHLVRPPKQAPTWTLDQLDALVQLPELVELALDGVAHPPGALELLSRTYLPRLERLDLASAPSSNASLGPPTPRNARADYPYHVHVAGSPLSHASEPSWVLEMLLHFPALLHLRLAGLSLSAAPSGVASACLFPDGLTSSSTKSLSLRSLSLDEVEVSDQELSRLLVASSGRLEQLSLRRCTGHSRVGLVEAIKTSGGRLRRLDLEAPSTARSIRSPTTSPTTPPATPPRSPPFRPAASPVPLVNSPFVGILDACLPFLPSLTHLSSTGPLLSPALVSELHALTPHLRHLSIISHPHALPAHLLPLVRSSPPSEKRLPSLRCIELQSSPSSMSPFLPTCAPWSTSPNGRDDTTLLDLCTSAFSSGVELIGEVFEATQDRLRWAEQEAEKLAKGVEQLSAAPGMEGKGEVRRKRPGVAL
ncbi:hypothetical protein JCM10213v2_000480 [Rhodosporidiobolus nylandii]